MDGRFHGSLALGLAVALGACRPGGETIATVGGEAITRRQFDAYLKAKRLDGADDKRRAALLDDYLEREALAAAIEDSGRLDADVIAAEVRELEKELLISRYFETYLAQTVTDEAVLASYKEHEKEFEKEKVRVAHILFRTDRAMSDSERDAKRTAAMDVHAKLKKGDAFAALAKKHSEDRISAEKDGDLGWIERGAIAPELSDRAFAMKAGEVSEPFATSFGWHIVRVLEGPVTSKQPFEQVRGDIRYRLRKEKKDAELERLRNEAKVKKS